MTTETANIVLVEDDQVDEVLLRRALNSIGIELSLLVLHDGAEAIRYLSRAGEFSDRSQFAWPSLMLLDLRMPRVDGFEVLAWCRRQTNLPEFPIFVLSSSSREADIKKAMDLGAAGYSVKAGGFHYQREVLRVICERLFPAGHRALQSEMSHLG